MLLNKEDIPAEYIIKSYENGNLKVNDKIISHSVILSARHLMDWEPCSFKNFQTHYWEPVFSLHPEILIIGMREAVDYPHASILAPLYERDISFEIMTTAAACRTAMLLFSEKRKVVAALMIGTVEDPLN